ncbi:uncharacterized protein BO66DRAFT_150106 [Aspergillus aculeatinus CBS 121060]|uniref:Uncharacterized protein n=1 Tax=Aspergillus aculeatinus CBS 121060 TaxID=1448322 RepID=A0ACD1H1Q1_9EURO|nr:hypothetical protein BO66DRAFT_150106 [Aspergillus aculeatinus CBS 121060]RAH67666.1 hypothetical protein BO66DRAFT_150106 [Aspergillus aculeatinus CBS 121060]
MLNITCNVCEPCCLELFFFLTQFFPADTSATLLHGDKTSIRLFSFHRQEKLVKASAFLPFFMIVCYSFWPHYPLSWLGTRKQGSMPAVKQREVKSRVTCSHLRLLHPLACIFTIGHKK